MDDIIVWLVETLKKATEKYPGKAEKINKFAELAKELQPIAVEVLAETLDTVTAMKLAGKVMKMIARG